MNEEALEVLKTLAPLVTTIICAVIGSSAGFGFIQYLITRKDKKEEEKKKNHEEELKQEMKDHLKSVNDQWKVDYCDKNAKAIAELVEEVRVGLAEREEVGKKRYDEHHLAIEKMSLEHQKDFTELKRAVEKLTENDTKITESIKKIADKQDIMAEANVGMIHNTLIRFTDPIIERNAVTYEELDTLDSLYLPYSRLGGNGECKRRYNDVNKLKKISKEEAFELDKLKEKGVTA